MVIYYPSVEFPSTSRDSNWHCLWNREGNHAKLASDGFNVALNDLRGSLHKLEDVAALATQHGVDTILVPGDVSSEADVEKMVGDTVNHFGGLDAVGLS